MLESKRWKKVGLDKGLVPSKGGVLAEADRAMGGEKGKKERRLRTG
jgi:hypothetical protein